MTMTIHGELEATTPGVDTVCHPSSFDGPAHRGQAPKEIAERWNAAGGARAGEIKPHTSAGIRAGLRQLAGRLGSRGTPLRSAILVTYRRLPEPATRPRS